jgi:hypothetical protein
MLEGYANELWHRHHALLTKTACCAALCRFFAPTRTSLPSGFSLCCSCKLLTSTCCAALRHVLCPAPISPLRFFSVLFLQAAKLHASFVGGSMTLLPLVPDRPARTLLPLVLQVFVTFTPLCRHALHRAVPASC